jgi:hypothetical protein
LKLVFQFANQKYKDYNIEDYNFACCFVWVWNLVSHIRGECRLKVFENKVLRRMFGLERDEVTGKWRKLHHE